MHERTPSIWHLLRVRVAVTLCSSLIRLFSQLCSRASCSLMSSSRRLAASFFSAWISQNGLDLLSFRPPAAAGGLAAATESGGFEPGAAAVAGAAVAAVAGAAVAGAAVARDQPIAMDHLSLPAYIASSPQTAWGSGPAVAGQPAGDAASWAPWMVPAWSNAWAPPWTPAWSQW